mmetsp:Transcript_17270/g.69457  ORF Transcript_17270/g.69457 Transcript_17270/m.69457 type:complete len:238 (+) Transcript_17270:222-935(+)
MANTKEKELLRFDSRVWGRHVRADTWTWTYAGSPGSADGSASVMIDPSASSEPIVTGRWKSTRSRATMRGSSPPNWKAVAKASSSARRMSDPPNMLPAVFLSWGCTMNALRSAVRPISTWPTSACPGKSRATREALMSASMRSASSEAASAENDEVPALCCCFFARSSLSASCFFLTSSYRRRSSGVSGTRGYTRSAPEPSLLRATYVKTPDSTGSFARMSSTGESSTAITNDDDPV